MEGDVNETRDNKKKQVAKILAIISIAAVFAALLFAVVFDVVAFKEVLLTFVAALIVPAIAFVVLFIAMIASLICVFGIFLLKEYNFWPLTLSIDLFKDIIKSIEITNQMMQTFIISRIVLIAICFSIIVVAIVSKGLYSSTKELVDEKGKKLKPGKGFRAMSTVALIFAILGLIVSTSAVILVWQI